MATLVLLAAALGFGCSTAPPKPVVSEPIIYEIADLTISLRYLDEETLIARHGRNDSRVYSNPYYGYPGLITKKRLLVFEFDANTTESQVEFRLNKINLNIDDVRGDAKSRPYLRTIWNHYRLARTTAMDLTMKKTILDREFTVTPDEPVSGYLVFGENYPEEGGEALIVMSVSTPSGDEGRIEIPLQFSSDGTIGSLDANSGIFEGE